MVHSPVDLSQPVAESGQDYSASALRSYGTVAAVRRHTSNRGVMVTGAIAIVTLTALQVFSQNVRGSSKLASVESGKDAVYALEHGIIDLGFKDRKIQEKYSINTTLGEEESGKDVHELEPGIIDFGFRDRKVDEALSNTTLRQAETPDRTYIVDAMGDKFDAAAQARDDYAGGSANLTSASNASMNGNGAASTSSSADSGAGTVTDTVDCPRGTFRNLSGECIKDVREFNIFDTPPSPPPPPPPSMYKKEFNVFDTSPVRR